MAFVKMKRESKFPSTIFFGSESYNTVLIFLHGVKEITR